MSSFAFGNDKMTRTSEGIRCGIRWKTVLGADSKVPFTRPQAGPAATPYSDSKPRPSHQTLTQRSPPHQRTTMNGGDATRRRTLRPRDRSGYNKRQAVKPLSLLVGVPVSRTPSGATLGQHTGSRCVETARGRLQAVGTTVADHVGPEIRRLSVVGPVPAEAPEPTAST